MGEDTFGEERWLNQMFYKTPEWLEARRQVIIRDNGYDLGMEGFDIYGSVLVHHINVITIDDILNHSPKLLDLENLICVSHKTHNAIHYGDPMLLEKEFTERSPNDTCPWIH